MLIAREKEIDILKSAAAAGESKFIAVYGRRRVGKTYMIREVFGDSFTFQHTGFYGVSTTEQLFAFTASLKQFGLQAEAAPKNWLEAFELFKDLIRASGDKKKIIFFDELPWMDSGHGDLIAALEGFWNGWASARKDILLIVCGSSTSWMLDKIIHNKGGLYNRLSDQINLRPFTLKECEEYAREMGLALNRQSLLECYMILGGVPYYWSFLKKSLSLSQNIDEMFFVQDAPLKKEFQFLYRSLFKKPENYIAIIRALGQKRAGLSRNEILKKTGMANSGIFTQRLEDLENCGFIRKYYGFGKKKRDAIYQLIDNFTLFYFKFMDGHMGDEHYWSHQLNTPGYHAWCGLAFERVCLLHISEIKKALGIAGVSTEVCSWQCLSDAENGINGSQIDLLIVRGDRVINLCEMKYSSQEYAITKSVDESLRHKLADFCTLSKTRYAIHLTFVTTYGLKENSYFGNIQSVITMEDLFGGL